MKKSVFLILVFLLCTFVVYGETPQKIFKGDGFEFKLPENWVEIPKEQIADFEKKTKVKTGTMIKWNHGYQPKGSSWFTAPYIMVKLIENGKIPDEGLRMHDKSIDDVKKEAKGTKIEIIDYSYDNEKKSSLMTYKFPVDIKHYLLCVSSVIFTEKGFIEISGFSEVYQSKELIPFYKKAFNNTKLHESLIYSNGFKLPTHFYKYIIGAVLLILLIIFKNKLLFRKKTCKN